MASAHLKEIEAASREDKAAIRAAREAIRQNRLAAKRAIREAAVDVERLIGLLNSIADADDGGDRPGEAALKTLDIPQETGDFDDAQKPSADLLRDEAGHDAELEPGIADSIDDAEGSGDADIEKHSSGSFERLLDQVKSLRRKESGPTSEVQGANGVSERELSLDDLSELAKLSQNAEPIKRLSPDGDVAEREPEQAAGSERPDAEPASESEPATMGWREEFNQARLEARRAETGHSLLQAKPLDDDVIPTEDDAEDANVEDVWFSQVNSLMSQVDLDDRQRLSLRKKLLRPIAAVTNRIGAMAEDREDTF